MQRYFPDYPLVDVMVPNDNGGWVRYDAAQAEIARLTAERDEWNACAWYHSARAEKAEAERDDALARHWHSEPDTEIGGYSAFTAPDGSVWVHSSAVTDASDLIQHSQAERDAIAAAAFEEAARCYRFGAGVHGGYPMWSFSDDAEKAIRSLTPSDAKAALDRMIAEAAPAPAEAGPAMPLPHDLPIAEVVAWLNNQASRDYRQIEIDAIKAAARILSALEWGE